MIHAVDSKAPRQTVPKRTTKLDVLRSKHVSLEDYAATLRRRWDEEKHEKLDFLSKDPDSKPIIDTATSFLAQGMSPDKVAEITLLEPELLRQIRDKNAEAIASIRLAIARNLAESAQILSEQLVEKARDLPVHRIAQSLGVVIDKYQLLSGGVTARLEHRNVPTVEDLEKMFAALPRADATEVVQPEEQTNGNELRRDPSGSEPDRLHDPN